MSLRERPVSVDDVPAIVELLAAVERAEPADEAWSEDEIIDEVSGVDIDLTKGSIAVVDPEDGDRLVGVGVIDIGVPTDVWRAYLFGGVHPDYWHRGIGTRIVQVLGDQAKVWRDTDHPGLPGELKMWILSGRHGTAALAGESGFEPWRYFFRMRRDLEQPVVDVPEPAGYEIRAYRDEDAEAVRLSRNSTFADHWGSGPMDPQRWQQQMVGAPAFRPGFSFVATDATGAIGGFLLAEEFDVETKMHGYRTGYIALVGSERPARGRGLGSALVTRSIAAMAADGCRYSELTVDVESPTGAGRIYERVGFTTLERNTVTGRRF